MENQESRDEKKKRFLEAQEIRRKKKSNQGNYSGSKTKIPDYKYLFLKPNACQVFRMVGNPVEVRKELSDPMLVERSLIIDDAQEYFPLIWSNDPNHPLNVLRRKLVKYTYVKKDGSEKKVKVYDNQGCELLDRFLTNGKENPSSMEQGWNPGRYVLANVIDRMDSWCVDNKSTKVLAWKENPSKNDDGKMFYEPGMKISLYKEIFDVKCTTYGDYEDFDLVIRRFTEKTRPSIDTNFSVFHPEEKTPIKKWGTDDKVDYYSHIKLTDYLDDADASLNRFPLEGIPFISLPTPVGIIMAKVGGFIKDYDKKYKANIWDMCVARKEEELEALRNSDTQKSESVSVNGTSFEKSEVDADLPSDPETRPVTRTPKVIKHSLTRADLTPEILELFPNISGLLDEELALIDHVDIEEQEIVWNVTLDATCGDTKCEEPIPYALTNCPYCGSKF
jgi:hypothetical protein